MKLKQHDRAKVVCGACRHPVNTIGHEDMTIAVKHYKGGKSKMIRVPCHRCIEDGRREK